MPLPASVPVAAGRLARRLVAEAAPEDARGPRRTLVVGAPASRELEAALGPVHVVAAPEVPALPGEDGAYDVAVALDWLHRLADPSSGLAELRRLAPALLIAAPREPLAARGLMGTAWLADRLGAADVPRPARTSWSGPGFLRFASTVGAVRDVAHPLGWTVVWVRAD